MMGQKPFQKQITAALRLDLIWGLAEKEQLHKAYMHTHDVRRVLPNLSGWQGFKNSSVLNGCIGYMDEMLTFL